MILFRYLLLAGVVFNIQFAQGASVATSSPESTEVARKILSEGGNAIDAACAAFFVQSVTQSYFTGLGGGGFAVLQNKGKTFHYDFRESAPSKVTSGLYSGMDLKAPNSWSLRNTGGVSVGVPGSVAGCDSLIRNHGKKKWKDIIAPAINYAKNGFQISKMYSEELAEQWGRIKNFEVTREIFKGKSGTGLKAGELLRQPLLAQTLEKLSNEGSQSFYQGAMAKQWSTEAQLAGSWISLNDLEKYKVMPKKPVQFRFGKYEAVTAAPSSSASLMVGSVLRYLNHHYQLNGKPSADSIDRKIVEIETISHFASIRNSIIGDPGKTTLNPASWYGSKEEKKAWGELDAKIDSRLKLVSKDGQNKHAVLQDHQNAKETSHTSNISVMDDQGNAIALTTSVGEIFGSGITVPKFGFILNSTMGDFSPDPKNINSPGAGLRPRSNVSPTLIYEKTKQGKKLVAVLGAAGGPLIPQAIVQFFQNYFVHGMSGDESIRFPRVGVSSDGSVEIEKSAGKPIFDLLKKAGYDVNQTETVWAVFNGVMRKDPDTKWEAVSESRYDGRSWSDGK